MAPAKASKAQLNDVSRNRSTLKIAYVPIDSIKVFPQNPRRHSRRQLNQLRRSIRTYGFVVPALTDRNGNLLAGHGRLEAAREEGLTAIPVIRVDHLTPAQAQAFRIADNRLAEMSEWDDALLATQLKELSLADIDLEATGFTLGEVDLRIEGLDVQPAGSDPADTLPAEEEGPPVSRLGDLYQAGRHRIACADARDPAVYRALMQGRKAEMVFSDPPYNVRIDGHCTGNGKTKHREFVTASGELDSAEFTDFLLRFVRQAARYSIAGALLYICIDWRHLKELLAAAEEAGLQLLNLCVWTKDRPGLGSLYRSQHEIVLVLKSGKAPHRNNVQLGVNGRNRSNVWFYASIRAYGRASDEGKMYLAHPTVKPVCLVADALLDASARGGVVLDPFLGSGTTLIAAERTGRSCHGIEMDPRYVDLIIRRFQAYTGEAVIHVPSGKSFDEIATQRGRAS